MIPLVLPVAARARQAKFALSTAGSDGLNMNRERRKGLNPLPLAAELAKLLTMPQMTTIQQLERFGWTLEIVRRPLFITPVALLKSSCGKQWMAVEADGQFVDHLSIAMR